jgi:hypothetical protein
MLICFSETRFGMTALGIGSIVIGVALVCAGLIFWLRVPRIDPAGQQEPNEFRPIIDALEEEDRRTPDEASELFVRAASNIVPSHEYLGVSRVLGFAGSKPTPRKTISPGLMQPHADAN